MLDQCLRCLPAVSTVTSSFKVVQIVRPKLSCRACETIERTRPLRNTTSIIAGRDRAWRHAGDDPKFAEGFQ